MQARRISQVFGTTATLIAASLIHSASGDEKKPDAPPPPPLVQVNPADIPQLIKDKLPIPDNALDKVLDIADYNKRQEVIASLPVELGVKIARKGFNEQIKALKENSSDLQKKEDQIENFFRHIPEEKLKSILEIVKTDFQNLIETYIDSLADTEHKGNNRKPTKEESASWNSWVLGTKLLTSNVIKATPKDFFKESWYKKVEKITERLDELTNTQPNMAKKWTVDSIGSLTQLEAKENKEPKLYKILLALVDKEYINASSIIRKLAEPLQVELTKKILDGIRKALTNNTKSLDLQESDLEWLLKGFPEKDLQPLLLKTKIEYQNLIEAYIEALSNSEHKANNRKSTFAESAYYNGWALDTKIITPMLQAAPPGLFKESWYPKIEKIVERMDQDFDGIYLSHAKEHSSKAVVALSNLERQKNSEVKEPKLFNTLLTIVGKGHLHPWVIINSIPKELQTQLTKAVLVQTKNALVKNESDLDTKENTLDNLLKQFPADKLKSVLLENKKEYQELIEAYIDALSDKESEASKRKNDREQSVYWNAWALNTKFLNPHLKAVPPGLFKESWYPKIEKIIEQISKEFANDSGAKSSTINTLTNLVILELKKDSDIKEPKLFKKLIELTENNPKAYFPSNYSIFYNSILGEAILNDDGKGNRAQYGKYPYGTTYLESIVPDKSLITPYENLIRKITNALPVTNNTIEDTDLHDALIQASINLAKSPFERSQCIIDFQDNRFSKISKAKIEEQADLLADLQSKITSTTQFPGYNRLVENGKRHLVSIINTGLKHLLDEDSKKNDFGSKIVLVARNFYPGAPISITENLPLRNAPLAARDSRPPVLMAAAPPPSNSKLTSSILDRFQNKELKDDIAIAAYINFISVAYTKDVNDNLVLKKFASSLNNQILFASKAKQNAENPAQVISLYKREHELLKGINILVDSMQKDSIPYTKRMEHAQQLFKLVREEVIKGSASSEVLNEARELLFRIRSYPIREQGEERKKFHTETLIPLFKSLMENSNNLSSTSKRDFHNEMYTALRYYYMDSYLLDEIFKTLSTNCFNTKNDKSLEPFINFTNVTNTTSSAWNPQMIMKMISLNKNYLDSVLKETETSLVSPKADVQIGAINDLVSYKNFLEMFSARPIEPFEEKICTPEESKRVGDLIKAHINAVNGSLVNNFGIVKVQTSRIPENLDHTINESVFQINAKVLEGLVARDKNLRNNYLDIVANRLKSETDPRTRGLLYRSLFRLSEDKGSILKIFKKAMITENHPITLQYTGEDLGEMFFQEMDNLLPKSNTNRGNWYDTVRIFGKNIEEFNNNFKQAIKSGDVKFGKDEPLHNILAFVVASSRGQNIETLLMENLDEELRQKLASTKSGDEVDPRIIEAANKIINNANNVLSGFARKVADNELSGKYANYDSTKKVENEFNKFNKEILSILEQNLYWSPPATVPHIAAAIMSCENLDNRNKIETLNEILFRGKAKFSVFERCEYALLKNCIEAYKNTFEKKKDFEKTTCAYLWKKLDEFGPITSEKTLTRLPVILTVIGSSSNVLAPSILLVNAEAKDREKRGDYNSLRKKLSEELLGANAKLYTKNYLTPLQELKLKFLEVFITYAPNRQRRDYIETVLNTFELNRNMPQREVNRIIEE